MLEPYYLSILVSSIVVYLIWIRSKKWLRKKVKPKIFSKTDKKLYWIFFSLTLLSHFALLIFLVFFIPNLGFSASMNHIGEKGESSEVDRVIEIKMYDNYFEPNVINIKKGETIKFLVKNLGLLVHEFNIATKKMHLNHQPEMMEMMENEILLGDKIDYKKMKEIDEGIKEQIKKALENPLAGMRK